MATCSARPTHTETQLMTFFLTESDSARAISTSLKKITLLPRPLQLDAPLVTEGGRCNWTIAGEALLSDEKLSISVCRPRKFLHSTTELHEVGHIRLATEVS